MGGDGAADRHFFAAKRRKMLFFQESCVSLQGFIGQYVLMKRLIILAILALELVGGTAYAQRYMGNYGDDDKRHVVKSKYPPSERGKGFALRFGLEGGNVQMGTFNVEYEICPIVSLGIGAGGGYHLDAGLGVPLYLETRAYAPNSLYSGYVSLRLGYMFGLGEGKQVPTQQTLYGHPLTRLDKLGGYMASMGLGFSWKRLDVGMNFGMAFGNFEKFFTLDGETFHQWMISRKAYPMVSVQASYSLRLWKKEPYNKVVKKN